MSPSTKSRQYHDEPIYYAFCEYSLGQILVALSPSGICAVSLGNDAKQLTSELLSRFPNAQAAGNNEEIRQALVTVSDIIEQPKTEFDLSLALRGTAFQQLVWSALRNIPPGSTISYSELARRIGAPKSIRSVASACAANRLAVVTPCHRVVRKDGSLSNYHWGVGLKAELLRREKTAFD